MSRLYPALLLLMFANIASAAPSPCYRPMLMFRGMLDQVRAKPALGEEALELLLAVGVGTQAAVADETLLLFGFEAGELNGVNYQFNYCRVHAFETIGKLGMRAAIPHLEAIRIEDFEDPDRHYVFGAAQFALFDTRLAQIPSAAAKARYFQTRLQEESGYGPSWATDRVCETTLLPVLPAAQQHLISRSQRYARFCEARMRALAAHTDRLSALAAVLRVPSGPLDRELMQWAQRGLTAMRSPRADAELERFEREVLALPEDFPDHGFLIGLADDIWSNFGFPQERRHYRNGDPRRMRIM